MRRTVYRPTEPTPNIATVHFSQSDATCMGARFPICNRALPARTSATVRTVPCQSNPIQVRATLRSISYQVRSPHFRAGSAPAARFPSLKKGDSHENEKTIR